MPTLPGTRTRLLASLAALCLLSAFAFAGNNADSQPRSPAEELKAFEVADGLQVELVAAEPLVESPCAMAFDERGRLFVAENRGYPIGVPEGQPPVGRIALLEDTDGDGRMDKRTTFAEGLTFPNGVMPWKGGLIVTCAPDVLFLQDTDGDGKADVRRVLLTGFDTTKSTQLRVNKPTLGPDGWIYFAAGLTGGSITSPEHPEMPALKMTGDLRWNPRTGVYENVDGRSQYGMSFDDFGRRFICMNRIQVQHVVLSAKDLQRNPLFAFSDTVQNCPELIPNMLMHSTGGAARIYPISSNITTADSHVGTFSAACAIMIWRGGALPLYYRGYAITCDPTGNLVHIDKLEPKGATFAAVPLLDKKELLASRDDWTRPVFLESGPDGGLYVCDMYRRVIEHPDYLPQEIRKHTNFEGGKELGRIWRISQKSQREVYLPKAGPSTEELVGMVAGKDGWASATAFRLLTERADPNDAAPVRAVLKDATPAAPLLRLLAIQQELRLEDLQQAVRDPLSLVNSTALSLAQQRPEWQQVVFKTAADQRLSTHSKLQRVLLVPRVEEQDFGLLVQMLVGSDRDRWQEAAVLSACPGKASELVRAVKLYPGICRAVTSSFCLQAGRLIGLEQPTMSTAQFVKALRVMDEESFALVAGFCETRKKGRAPLLEVDDPGVSELVRKAVETLRENPTEGRADEKKLSAISLLAFAPWETAGKALLRVALDRTFPATAEAALRALAEASSPEVVTTLLKRDNWETATPAWKEATLSSLLARPQHLTGILDVIERQDIPASAIASVRRVAFLKHKDPAIRERAEKLFTSATGDRQKVFEAAKEALTLTPNAAHGHQLFTQACTTCHRLNQEGSAVGPDLFDIRNQPKESILFHIIIPDAEIAPTFTAYLAETKDGRTLAGLLASETTTSVTLRMPLAQEETILRTNLSKLTALPNSLMPTGLDGAMSKQDLADLLGYLKGEK